MHIEKLYFEKWNEERGLLENACDDDAFDCDFDAHLEQILRKLDDRRAASIELPRPFRRRIFQRVAGQALQLAALDNWDVVIDTHADRGVIRLESDNLILNDICPPTYKSALKALLRWSDEVTVFPIEKYGQNLLQYIYGFHFTRTVNLKILRKFRHFSLRSASNTSSGNARSRK